MKITSKKHLLIGGPGTGKSSTLKKLEKKGHVCFPEIARQITLEAQQEGIEQLFITNPLAFSNALLEGRIHQYHLAEQTSKATVYIDRGIPDITAYLDYTKQAYPSIFTEANKKYRYDTVFHFPIWEEIFRSDNERYENFEQAKQIDYFLQNTYTALGYELITVPVGSIEERAIFILQYHNQ